MAISINIIANNDIRKHAADFEDGNFNSIYDIARWAKRHGFDFRFCCWGRCYNAGNRSSVRRTTSSSREINVIINQVTMNSQEAYGLSFNVGTFVRCYNKRTGNYTVLDTDKPFITVSMKRDAALFVCAAIRDGEPLEEALRALDAKREKDAKAHEQSKVDAAERKAAIRRERHIVLSHSGKTFYLPPSALKTAQQLARSAARKVGRENVTLRWAEPNNN